MNCKALTIAVFTLLALNLGAELRRFQNADETKSFFAELTGYDTKTKQVSVRLKNGRRSTFSIDILSEDDKKYVTVNGPRLAIGNDIRVTLKDFKEKSKKVLEPRIENRVYPSGYTISLSNRAKETHTDITINYTLYYGVQDYLKPERTRQEKSGSLSCEKIASQATVTLKTETVDIVSGKLDPVLKQVTKRDGNGTPYTEEVVDKPGGRRKDLLLGCKVDIVVNGEVVKSITDGTIAIESPEDND
ncbi:MAG: hypothetical protein H7A51_01850 [Akkermansiaceae bacterium]|nr:hypothetical protein [Akkermansiaceae bacterium]